MRICSFLRANSILFSITMVVF